MSFFFYPRLRKYNRDSVKSKTPRPPPPRRVHRGRQSSQEIIESQTSLWKTDGTKVKIKAGVISYVLIFCISNHHIVMYNTSVYGVYLVFNIKIEDSIT